MASTIVDLMSSTLSKLREMIDVNTVVGDSVTTPDGTTIIPVSRVGLGFATGGADWDSKGDKGNANGGAGGGGITVTPVSFLVVSPTGSVKLIPVEPANGGSTIEKVIEAVPTLIDTVEGLIEKFR